LASSENGTPSLPRRAVLNRCLVPSTVQLRRAADRELFLSGLRMAVGETV
jgi:hypothetical protein